VPGATEAACQRTIVELARDVLGYRVLAIRPAIGRQGRWQSPIQGDAGYPDLTLVHPRAGVLFVELKRKPNRLDPDQKRWGEALREAGAEWRVVWVPEQLDAFCQELADRTKPREHEWPSDESSADAGTATSSTANASPASPH
jgi:VRR-NUC domain-containing protein